MSFTEFYRILERFIDLLKIPGYIDDDDEDTSFKDSYLGDEDSNYY